MKYEHDEGILFPKLKEKSQKLLPRVVASPIGRQIMTVGTIQKHGYDKALALLFSVVVVFGGYYFIQHHRTLVEDVRGGYEIVQDEFDAVLIADLRVAEDASFGASAKVAWSAMDDLAVRWYRAICGKIRVCTE